jgi:hypothetical protein
MSRAVRIAAAALGAIAGLTPLASACPSCSVGQGLETLAYILAFMAIPYLVVSGVLYWVRKVISEERGL